MFIEAWIGDEILLSHEIDDDYLHNIPQFEEESLNEMSFNARELILKTELEIFEKKLIKQLGITKQITFFFHFKSKMPEDHESFMHQ